MLKLCAYFIAAALVMALAWQASSAAFWIHGSSYSGPPPVQYMCPGTDVPFTTQAQANAAAAGYTQEVFCDNFTSTSTIYLNNTPPYPPGYNWYMVPGSAWHGVTVCTAAINAGAPDRAWCQSSAQNPSGFATVVGGKVNLQSNVSNAGFGTGAQDIPILVGCRPTTTPPFFDGTLPVGGFYIEMKFATGSYLPTVLWMWNADFLSAGDGQPMQVTELDNPDNGGNGRAMASWFNPANSVKSRGLDGGESPQDTITTSLVMGVLAMPGTDNTGQSIPGIGAAGTPLLNWYNSSGYVSSSYGTGAAWPSGDNIINQLTGHGSYPQHNCLFISGYPSAPPVIVDWIRVWAKPQGTTVAFQSIGPTTGSFTAGTSTAFMTETATLSSGTFAGTWSIATTGNDNAGTTCVNYGSNFTINSSTGAITNNASVAAGSYPGLCVVATQSGVSNSPYTQAVTATGVTVSAQITTVSIQNTDPTNPVVPGATGYPYIIGQVFARSNSNSVPWTGIGNYPVCQDASNNALLTCQWDDIASRRENSDDGSWRHAVLSVLLPATSPQYTTVTGGSGLAPCTSAPAVGQPCAGQFQIKLVNTSGTYSSSAHGSINDICNGHDIKLVLTDVRNQNDTLRGTTGHTGTLTFDTCTAISNTGRDAPTQYAKGPVKNSWIVRGAPWYDAANPSTTKDPLLYVVCFMDQTYTLSGAIGPLRHVCTVHNGWMNVAAGTTGNAGNPGPAGFTNDPQLISYRAGVYDGSTQILDIGSNFDATVSNTTNFNASTHTWTIPSSVAGTNNSWGRGMGFRYTASATPPGGLTSGQLIYTCGTYNDCPFSTPDLTQQALANTPWPGDSTLSYTGTQGTGNSTFSYRVVHYHGFSWEDLDPTALENWVPAGGSARYVSNLLPYYHSAERTYIEQTGSLLPLQDVSANSHFQVPASGWSVNYLDRYAPMDQNNMYNGQGGGSRPQLGLTNEFFARAFSIQSAAGWQSARVAGRTQGAGAQFADVLNEATGHVPVLNNGPPGSNHGGAGGTYTGLGANFPTTGAHFSGTTSGSYILPLEGVPVASNTDYFFGNTQVNSPLDDAHASSFNGNFQLFGSEDLLWMGYQQATWLMMVKLDGRNKTVGSVNFYDTYAGCCERRGAAWSERDLIQGAAYGCDVNCPTGSATPERQYFNDVITEDYYYALAAHYTFEPPTPNSGCILGALAAQGCTYSDVTSVFFDYYLNVTYATLWGVMHAQKAKDYLSQQYRSMSATCGDGVVPNSASLYYCGVYYYWPNVHSSPTPPPSNCAGAAGCTFNTTDALDYESAPSAFRCPSFLFTNGSSIVHYWEGQDFDWMDTNVRIHFVPITENALGGALPPQLSPGTFYWMVNPVSQPGYPGTSGPQNSPGSDTVSHFQIAATQNGTPLGPFTVTDTGKVQCSFERHNQGITETGAYFQNPGYGFYALAGLNLLQVVNPSLGSIMTQVNTVRNAAWGRVASNTGGWLGPDDADNNVFTQMHLDNTIVQQ